MKKTILFFTLLTMIIFASCDKNTKGFSKEDFGKDKNYDKDKNEDKAKCFDLIYPITYTMPDGTTITGDENTIKLGMDDWYATNPNSKEKPTLNYPVNIVFEDGTSQTVANENEMLDLKKDCYGDKKLESCTWDEANEAGGSSFEKITVKELKYSTDCNCIEEGVEKFLENGQTKFLIYYESKECKGYGYKVTCENGDCDDGVKCFFLQDCEAY